ncbi:hypothetical protein ACRYCC_30660 [Actinomadura scrupuli]|uniref:hypothetical protein n=1 Tax=Actinomadura scrupuli TaxID=559629 RepID=UPI003D9540B5
MSTSSTAARPARPQKGGGRRTGRRTWVKAISARSVYAVVALPVGIAALIAALFGAAAPVDRAQRVLARRLLGVPVAESEPPQPRRTGQVLRHSLARLPADLVSFALMGPAWAVFLTRGVLYPVFGADNLNRSWGGPTLAGAWAAHFIQGPPLLLAITLVLWPVSRYQARLAGEHFGISASSVRPSAR